MQNYWLKAALLFSVIFLASCQNNCNDQCRESYREGYRAGESYGYDRGRDVGHRTGYREGYSDGETDGYRRGYMSGTGALISDGTIPLVGITFLMLMFLITVVTILRVFRKPLEDFARQYGILLRSKILLVQSQSKAARHKKLREERARVVARTFSIETYLETEKLVQNLNISTEYLFILRSVEERLYACMVDSISDQSAYLLSLISTLKTNNMLLPVERKELAEILHSVLHSEVEHEARGLKDVKSQNRVRIISSESYQLVRRKLQREKLKRSTITTLFFLAACSAFYFMGRANLFSSII